MICAHVAAVKNSSIATASSRADKRYSDRMIPQPEDKFMRRCFELALLGQNQTGKNPKVGAVLVYDNTIIGEGYHKKFGGPHAEIEALASVRPAERHLIPLSTLYVSLEPCSHFGKTPPCTERIIAEGIKKVVVGCSDPNPLVSGKGIQYLRQNGADVFENHLQNEARYLIRPFCANLNGLPYIVLKWAASKDGYIGKQREQIWLTNNYSKMLVHKWRTESDGILVGKNTLLTDIPRLTVRDVPGINPLRIVADRQLRTISFLNEHYPGQHWLILNQVRDGNFGPLQLIRYHNDENLEAGLRLLFDHGIHTLLVEGGNELLTSMINAGLWHEARVFSTAHILTEGIKAPQLEGKLHQQRQIGIDKLHVILNPSLHYD